MAASDDLDGPKRLAALPAVDPEDTHDDFEFSTPANATSQGLHRIISLTLGQPFEEHA